MEKIVHYNFNYCELPVEGTLGGGCVAVGHWG